MRKIRTLAITLLLSLAVGLPALAHEGHDHDPKPTRNGKTDKADKSDKGPHDDHHDDPHDDPHGPAAHDDHGPHDHMHDHGGEDLDYSRAFKEGTPTIFSASTVPQDNFTLYYSHNFFWNTLPRGSNPAFWLKYSPLDHLQLDFMATLRSPLELEGGVAYQILDETRGNWLSLTPRVSFNSRGTIFGGEIAATKFIIPDIWQVGLEAQLISSGAADSFARPVAAVGLNTIVRVWKHWHVFGDVVLPFDGDIISKRGVLWSAGIKKRIPHTPHILTVYIGNEQEQSLSGRTISPTVLSTASGVGDILRLGFVFSISIDGISHFGERLF